ncbi:MAG: hypothetical protein EXS37_07895 [Opitutus sp.]|nr:hypothetical protein [Opitutus sp.]
MRSSRSTWTESLRLGARKQNVLVSYQRRSGASRVVATSLHGWMVTGNSDVPPIALRTFV